jgi:hypothetical protein
MLTQVSHKLNRLASSASFFNGSTTVRTVRTVKHPKPLKTRKTGIDILHDPLWNKSLAFTYSERDRLGLRGLIPPVVRTLEDQVQRVMGVLRSQPDDVTKNLYLQDIHNRNETLYHRILVDHVSYGCVLFFFNLLILPFVLFVSHQLAEIAPLI